MADYSSDSGYELVLDNRRLIVAFVVLILFCGAFFVLGFMEGKRQGYQSGAQAAVETAAPAPAYDSKETETPLDAADAAAPGVKEDTEKQQLNWYKNVSGQDREHEITAPPAAPAVRPEPKPVPKQAEPKAAAASSRPAVPSAYTVQVGAFRQRQQAEVKAKELRAKGFECRIEPPQSSDGLYLLKVGRFKSRSEAAATQLRLKKSGFSSFIKSN